MTGAQVLGLGQVSAVGAGIAPLRAALAGARPAVQWIERWPGDDGPRVPILRADPSAVRRLVPPAMARRLDDFGMGALGAALLAVEDAGLTADELGGLGRTGIMVATGYGALGSTFGFLHDVVVKGDGLASPLHFSRSVHNAPAFVISSVLGIRGPTTTLTGFSLAWMRALATVLDGLERTEIDLALLCSADEQHPVVVDALRALGVELSDGAAGGSPLERGHLPGETYTAMLLGRAGERASRWGRIERPAFFDLDATPAPERGPGPLFVATQGLPGDARRAHALARDAESVGTYDLLWGANPTSEAMTVLAALVSLHDDRCYALPSSALPPPPSELRWLEPAERAGLTVVRCATVDGAGRGALSCVRR